MVGFLIQKNGRPSRRVHVYTGSITAIPIWPPGDTQTDTSLLIPLFSSLAGEVLAFTTSHPTSITLARSITNTLPGL
jgi:hypothetical protein